MNPHFHKMNFVTPSVGIGMALFESDGRCGGSADCQSAIRQVDNLRYEEKGRFEPDWKKMPVPYGQSLLTSATTSRCAPQRVAAQINAY